MRIKGFYLDDDDVAAIAERAAARRADAWLATAGQRRGRRHDRGRAVADAASRCSRDVLERAADPEQWERFERQLRSTGYCRRPVRLRGQVDAIDLATGEVGTVYSTDARARRDAAEVLRQPPRGGLPVVRAHLPRRRLPARRAPGCAAARASRRSVAEHPMVFLTLTAPSFGPVHSRRVDGAVKARRCRPRRSGETCPHGVALACGDVHDEDDPRLGEPLCAGCFDYEHAVLWNAMAPELWRRTAIQIPRELARLTGVTQKRLRERVRVSYVKVAEYPAPRRAALPLSSSGSTASTEDRPSGRGAAGRVHGASCSIDAALAAVAARDGALPHSRRPTATAGSRPAAREIRWGRADRGARARHARRGARRRRTRGLHREVRDQEHRGGRRADVPARRRATSTRLKVRPHVRRWSSARGGWAASRISTSCGCGAGRTRSGSAGTASPRAAATRRPSPRCARRATSTCCAACTAASRATRGAGRSARARAWSTAAGRYAGIGYRTLGDAWLAESGPQARGASSGGSRARSFAPAAGRCERESITKGRQ